MKNTMNMGMTVTTDDIDLFDDILIDTVGYDITEAIEDDDEIFINVLKRMGISTIRNEDSGEIFEIA